MCGTGGSIREIKRNKEIPQSMRRADSSADGEDAPPSPKELLTFTLINEQH